VFDGATGNVTNCTISNNAAPRGLGGGFSVLGASAAFTACTFRNNNALQGGAVGVMVELHSRDKIVTASACMTVCTCVMCGDLTTRDC